MLGSLVTKPLAMLAKLLPLATEPLTHQQLADLMLSADRERRRLLRAGEPARAALYATELDLLAGQLSLSQNGNKKV